MRLERIEAQVYERLDQIDTYREGRLLLKNSMKGCGDVLSAVIITEIGDISRFRTMGEFVSYCRLAPASKLSNGKSKGQGNAKNGNAYLSWALTELATLMARYNKSIQHYLERKVKKPAYASLAYGHLPQSSLVVCIKCYVRRRRSTCFLPSEAPTPKSQARQGPKPKNPHRGKQQRNRPRQRSRA